MNAVDDLAAGTSSGSSCNQLHNPLGDQVAFYADAARSTATRRAYAADVATFSAWGGQVPAWGRAVVCRTGTPENACGRCNFPPFTFK